MNLAIEIIGWWTLLSCTIGPCLTWLFFYNERQRRAQHDRWFAQQSDIESTPHHIPQQLFQ